MREKENQENFLQKGWAVCLLALVCCALWGSAFPSIKIGYQLFEIASEDTAAQILFAGCRFFGAGILTILLGSILSRKLLLPKRSGAGKILMLALVQTVLQYLFFYVGLAHTTGVKGSIITGLNTFFSILLACLLFRQEKLTAKKLIGCLLGFAGVVLVNLNGSGIDLSVSFLGEGFMVCSAAASALSSVLIRRFSQDENPVVLSGYQFMLGGAGMILCGLAMGGRFEMVTAGGIGMLTYLAFLSAVAYSLWSILMKYNPVSRVTIYGCMNPVFGVLLSALLLGETDSLNLTCVAALLLVCVGIYTVNQRSKKV